MRTKTAVIAAIILLFGLAGGVSAALVGDEVMVEYVVKNEPLEPLSGKAIVDAGMDSPEIALSYYYEFYFDTDRVRIDFLNDDYFEGSSQFSGIAISSLNDTDNPDWVLLGVEVKTDMAGWTDDRLVFDDTGQYVGFNWQGLGTATGESFTAIFEFGPNPIPLPATMVLFVTGLCGFMAYRRFRRS